MEDLNETLKTKSRERFTEIMSNMDPKGYIVWQLFKRGIITPRLLKEINDGPDAATRAEIVLSHLFQTAHPESFVAFIDALKRDYGWIVKLIDVSYEPKKAHIFQIQNYNNIDLENCQPSDIISGFKEVKRKDLTDYIDPENGLLHKFRDQGIITDNEFESLQKIKPYHLLNEELLWKIEKKLDILSKEFIDALRQDDQDHIAKFIVTAGCETDSDERLLPRELRTVIDDNMFCLEKLIDTEKRDLELKLVREKCITWRHRERVINSKPEYKAHELLIILQRRRYKDFFNFMKCLRKTMQNNIVKILEKGGVSEIKVKLLLERTDKKDITTELIKKLTGYINDDNECELSRDQKKFVDELLAHLAEDDIYFIGTCKETSNSSISIFVQGEKEDQLPILNDDCKSGSLKDKLEEMFRSLLNIPDSWPPLVKEVSTGQHSNKHHVTAESEQNSNPSERRSLTEPQPNKRSRSSDEIGQENFPPHKKSKQFKSSLAYMNQSPSSTSVEESSVHCPNPEQQPHTLELVYHRTDPDRFLSSEINSEKPACRSELEVNLAKHHGEQPLVGTEQEMVDESCEIRQGISLKHTLKKTCKTGSGEVEILLHANASEDGSNDEEEMSSIDCDSRKAEFQNKIRKNCRDQYTTECYQLKIHQMKDDDIEKIIRDFRDHETLPILKQMELIKAQWRAMDLWEIVPLVNPSPRMKFDREELLRKDETSAESGAEMTLRRSIVLCCIFEDLMKKFGWKVGDTIDIEEDICDVVGKLLLNLNEQDRSSMLDCMQIAMVNIRANGSKPDGDKLRSLLITKKKYNGLNLACIILEQMIIDNLDNNVSWMRTVCSYFIDLVVPLTIEPDYRDDIQWNLNYLMKLGSLWSVADIYNLIRNGMLLYRQRQNIFHQHLTRIRNFAVPPTSSACLGSYGDDDIRKYSENVTFAEEKEKSIDQILQELKGKEVRQGIHTMKTIIRNSLTYLEENRDNLECGFELELGKIRNSELKDGIDVLTSCLSVVSMALHICKGYWPLNTQLVSYCLLVVREKEDKERSTKEKGRLLEILTGEGKSCIIAMVAATYALLGRTVDIVTSSPVLSQRDAQEWLEFYTELRISVSCNVDETRGKDTSCYDCPIVYGTVETFARDILKTEFLLQETRKGRKYDIVIVDEVDSMLIDQGVQCTYLSHDIASIGMRHFEPILSLVWMNVSRLWKYNDNDGVVWYGTEPEVFFVTLARISKDIDPLQILHSAKQFEEENATWKVFINEYLSTDIEGQKRLLGTLETSAQMSFFIFALNYLNLDFMKMSDISIPRLCSRRIRLLSRRNEEVDIVVHRNGLSSILFKEDQMKVRLTEMVSYVISDEKGTKIDLPVFLRPYYINRLQYWIDNAFLAKNMQLKREYIVQDNAIYPVDYESTGVIETNKKWGDGLQQFLEMKHDLPRSPLSLITNFLSNIGFFERYGNNVIGVSGTLGNEAEKKFMSDTFSVEFATIPTSKRRKLFELDGVILENEVKWSISVNKIVKSAITMQRAVLVICEDIVTADTIHVRISSKVNEAILYLHTKSDRDDKRLKKELKPGDVVITTNLGARGTDFTTVDVVNKNGGLFVLVTFIPLNDRVEKQAFGRTGRRGATGSCQIIVNRKTMPEWLRSCETVDEAKRLRDFIGMHRLKTMNQVNLIKKKQKLFREYCELKKKIVSSSERELDDNKIQLQLLDETWAKWIQDFESRAQKFKHDALLEELRSKIKDCSSRAKQFESDNLYHIMKFGAVRLMKGEFEEAGKFYDQVIRMFPAWSAFAHYNRAYCTLHMKGDGYIRRAIEDLNAALRIFQAFKKQSMFSEISITASYLSDRYGSGRRKANNMTDVADSRQTLYNTMVKCQLLHHIDTEIFETIEKLEKIDTMGEKMMTIMRRDILDLMPGTDCRMKQMLQEYKQLGLLFTYNIDEKPQLCYMDQIVSSLEIILISVAVALSVTFNSGILLKGDSLELKNMINAGCTGSIGDDPLGWMSQCATELIVTGIRSVDFILDVFSLISIKQNELESSFEMTAATSQFDQLANSQTISVLALALQEIKKSLSDTKIISMIFSTANVAIGLSKEKIQTRINKLVKKLTKNADHKLHRALCFLYSKMSSESMCNLQQFVNCVSDLVQLSVCCSQQSGIQTVEVQNLAVEFISKSRCNTETLTSMIKSAVEEIEIESVITKFSDLLVDKIDDIIQKTCVDQYSCDDVKMPEATNEVLTSAWSDFICSVVQSRISQSLMHKLQLMLNTPFELEFSFVAGDINRKLMEGSTQGSTQKMPSPISSDASCRLTKMFKDLKVMRYHHRQSITEARFISENLELTIIISDVDNEEILKIMTFRNSNRPIKLIYNPPCDAYEGGHYYRFGEMAENKTRKINNNVDDHNLLYSAISTVVRSSRSSMKNFINRYIREHPRHFGEVFANEHYACQLKRGRAILRLGMNHPTRQMNQCEYVELDSSHLFSSIEQSGNVSQLAKVLAEYESESRSAEANSSDQEMKMLTSPVSRDACKLFLFNGSSIEADDYTKLVAEIINAGDITTSLQLCCIGHQIPFYRDMINPISDVQSLSDTLERMLKMESYEQERSTFLSICDEWYRVLEPQGLMSSEQRELLREWISTRQYANTEDPIVSVLIENVKANKLRRGKKEEETKKPGPGKGRKRKKKTRTEPSTI